MLAKNILRRLCIALGIDITKNIYYDRLTQKIVQRLFKKDFNVIDIGAHKGEMIELFLKHAPDGKHIAFEPLPNLYKNLVFKYSNKLQLYDIALSNESRETSFVYVKNAPAYSGLQKRRYDIAHPELETINVQTKKLDDVVLIDYKIDFIKIDVEGAELLVLEGGINLLQKYKPYVLFEFGKGGSDYYGATPEAMYSLLVNNIALKLFTLKDFLSNKESLTLEKFKAYFENNKEYYFLAVP
jgi:FkbM family methyltransferase